MDNHIKPYYYDSCHGDETIIFLHGLGASFLSWEYQVACFKQNYRVIAPDIRGHGKSPLGKEAFSFERCADDIYALLQGLDIKKVHLCGFSFGGMVAFEFAVKYPDMLLSFCAVNVLARFDLNSPGINLLYQLRRILARVLPLKWLAYLMSVTLFPNKKDAHLRRKMLRQSVCVNRPGYICAIDAMQGWSVEKELEKIKVPALLIGSEFDYALFKEKEELANMMPNASYHEIKGAHHFVIWEYADEFNRVYKSFLESL
jgi:pimeloyl-ACP methyl ester carboxylesterase